MDHETQFSCDQQAATLNDAKQFVKYMASPELFDTLDMDSIRPMEGRGNQSNLRMHTTRIITNHMHEIVNKKLGVKLYEENDMSTLYRQVGEEEKKEEEVFVFGTQYKAHHDFSRNVKLNMMKLLLPSEPITDKDMIREIITIRHETKPLQMSVRIDNYVFVSYLCNKNDPRKRCKINLQDMAAKTLVFGIQHSRNKFAKNDLRYRWGSHLVFESGVLIETGCTSTLLAAKLLEHTMNIFRYVCGYYNIGVWERKCHNVVATGNLNFGLCLELLKDRYPYVVYEKKNFAGAIIRIKDINAFREMNGGNGQNNHNGSTILDNIDEFLNYEKNYPNVAEEYNRRYNNIGSESEQRERDLIQSNLSHGNNGVQYEVTYDEYDMLHILRGQKEKNIKALVFPGGRVICVGSRSREGVIESYTELFPILESCRDTPENIEEERRILQKRRYNFSKKRKREMMEANAAINKRVKIVCKLCGGADIYTNNENDGVITSITALLCNECGKSVCHTCCNADSDNNVNSFKCSECEPIK